MDLLSLEIERIVQINLSYTQCRSFNIPHLNKFNYLTIPINIPHLDALDFEDFNLPLVFFINVKLKTKKSIFNGNVKSLFIVYNF